MTNSGQIKVAGSQHYSHQSFYGGILDYYNVQEDLTIVDRCNALISCSSTALWPGTPCLMRVLKNEDIHIIRDIDSVVM